MSNSFKLTVVHTPEPQTSWFTDLLDRLGLIGTTIQVALARTAGALILGLTAGGAACYAGLYLTAYLAIFAATLTGSAFLAFMITYVGIALAFVASFAVCGKVQDYVLAGGIGRTTNEVTEYVAIKSIAVKEWFGSLTMPAMLSRTVH